MEKKGSTLIFGLGFTSEYIVRSITERGKDDVNEVILIGVFNVDEYRRKQADNTLNDVKKFLDIIHVKYNWRFININKDFPEIVNEIASLISGRNNNSNLEFYLIGGMRIINFALYYYAMLAKSFGLNVRVFSYTEDMSKKYELAVQIPRMLTESEIEILKLLEHETYMELSEMAKRLNKALSTISKQVSEMEKEGFLRCSEGRPKKCEKTILASIALTLI